MKNQFIIALLASILFVACNKNEPKDYTVISGQISNSQSDSIYIFLENRDKAIAVNEKGEFHDTIQLKKQGYFYFSDGREQTEIFLIPGDSLYINVDVNQFDESIKYQGKGAEKNNYLAQKFLLEEKIAGTSAELFSLNPSDFAEKFKQHNLDLENKLKECKAEQNFLDIESKNLKYNYLSMLMQFPEAHKYFTGNQVQIPQEYLTEIENINYDNEEDYQLIPAYQDLVVNKYMIDIQNAKNSNELETMIDHLQSKTIKQDILNALYYRISTSNPDSEKINNIIKKHSTSSELIQKSEQKTNSVRNLLAGKTAPKFEFANVKGKTTSLEQLKGKLVYIDVWATWCGPCIQEIPALKQLESDYKDKNVAFVSISIDSENDYPKWEKMLSEKDLKGIQLFAKGEAKENFSKAYGIDAIPRFILINKEGNIIQADAPRPSQAKIRDLLNKHL